MRSIGSVYVTILANSKGFTEEAKRVGREGGDASRKAYAREFEQAFSDIEKSDEFDKMAKKIAQDWKKIADENGTSLRHGLRNARLPEAIQPQLEELARRFGVTTDEVAKDIASRLGGAFDEVERDGVRAAQAIEDAFAKEEKAREREARQREKDRKRDEDNLARDLRRTEREVVKSERSFSRMFTTVRRGFIKMGSGGFFDGATTALGVFVGGFELVAKGVESVIGFFGQLGKAASDAGEQMSGFSKIFGMLGKGGGAEGGAAAAGEAGGALAALGASAAVAIPAILAVVAVLIVLETIAGAVVAAISALAGMIVILASAVTYAVGYLIVFAPMVVALGAAFGVLAISLSGAFKAMGSFNKVLNDKNLKDRKKDLKAYNDELKELAPGTRAFVKAMEPLLRMFQGLQDVIANQFFGGFTKELAVLAAPGGPVSVMAAGLEAVAQALGRGVGYILRMMESEGFMKSWTALWASLAPIVLNMTTALGGFIEGVVGFLGAIAPFTERLSKWISESLINFGKWATSVEGQNTIKTFMEDASGAAHAVWEAIMSVIHALGTLLGPEGAQKDGQGLLEKIEELAGKFKTWVDNVAKDGRLKQWLDDAKTVAENIGGAIKTLGETFAALNTEGNKKFLNWVIETLKTIIGWINTVITAIETLKTTLADVGKGLAAGNQGQGPSGARGGGAGRAPGGASGGLFSSATTMRIGEAGLEALIPLHRPLSMVDPSVRGMAAMIRGQQGNQVVTTSGGKTVNASITVVSQAADPAAVAVQVMNRAVVLTR